MIDLPSLFVLAGILFGLVAGDAALYGDTLRVQIAVPKEAPASALDEIEAAYPENPRANLRTVL